MKLFEAINILNKELNEFQDYDYSQDWNPEREDRDPDDESKRVNFPQTPIEKKTVNFISKKTKQEADLIEELANQFGNYDKKFIKFFIVYFKNPKLPPLRIVHLGTEKQLDSILKDFGKKTKSKEKKEEALKELIENNDIVIKTKSFKNSFLNGVFVFDKNNNFVIVP